MNREAAQLALEVAGGTVHEKSSRTTSLKREAGAFPGASRFPPTNKLNLKDDS